MTSAMLTIAAERDHGGNPQLVPIACLDELDSDACAHQLIRLLARSRSHLSLSVRKDTLAALGATFSNRLAMRPDLFVPRQLAAEPMPAWSGDEVFWVYLINLLLDTSPQLRPIFDREQTQVFIHADKDLSLLLLFWSPDVHPLRGVSPGFTTEG